MASLTDVRQALKARMASVVGLTPYAIEPASPHWPAAWVFPTRVNYHATYDDDLTYTMAVTVGVAASNPSQAQTNLDPYLAPSGDKSIVAALEADATDVLHSVRVVAMTNYFARDIAGGQAICAQLEVECFS